MIKFPHDICGFHYIIGISEPPRGTSERAYVFAWLGGIALMATFFFILVSTSSLSVLQH